ncbi:MAG: TonB-dependent receptor [Thermoanaerobaculia bacterium]
MSPRDSATARRRCVALLCAASIWTAGAFAADDEKTDDEKPAPPARFEQSLLVTTAPEVAEEVRIEGGDVASAPGNDLAGALRRQPGLDAARRGAVNFDPAVRGLQERQLLTLVDGTRTFAAGPARMDSGISHVGPESVQNVRVVKGPYALAWGSGALAAVRVETFTPAFDSGPGGRLSIGHDDNGARTDAAGSGWWSDDRFRIYGALEVREGGDYESGDGTEVPGDYTSREGRLGLGWQATESTRLEYRGSYQDQDDLDYPGRILDATYFTHRGHNLEVSWAGGSASALDEAFGRLYSNHKSHRMNNDEKPTAQPNPNRVPPFGIDVDLPTESDTEGATGHLAWSLGDARLEGGLEAFNVRQDAVRTISRRDTGAVIFVDRVWPDVSIDHGGAYLQTVLPRQDWTLTGTVRVDREESSAGAPSDFFLENTEGSVTRDDTSVSAALSWRRRVGSRGRILLGVGRVVRQPTALERYADRFPSSRFQVAAEFLGDPQLDPETALQGDLSLSWGGPALTAELDLFVRDVDDYITVQPDPDVPRRLPLSPMTVYRYINGEGATFWGGEASLVGRPTPAWSWRTSLSAVRGDDDTFDEPVFGMPPLTGRAGLRWQGLEGRFWVDGGVTVADDQTRVATTRLEKPTPGYTVVDLEAGWSLAERWRLRVRASNLLDEEYANHLNTLNPFTGERIPEPGRSVFAGIGVDL